MWNWGLCWTEEFFMWNWEQGGSEGFLVWNWGGVESSNLELRGLGGWKGVVLLSGTDVLNWGVVELTGPDLKSEAKKVPKFSDKNIKWLLLWYKKFDVNWKNYNFLKSNCPQTEFLNFKFSMMKIRWLVAPKPASKSKFRPSPNA